MTPAQCRAARALINMSHAELAMASIVPREMIADFEAGTRTPSATDVMAMRQAFEAAGIEFTGFGERAGVRFRKG